MSISKIFIPNALCVFSQIKDRKHIEQNFHYVARVMPKGGTCGCWGESKTLAWGFAMAPHRLRALVYVFRRMLLFGFKNSMIRKYHNHKPQTTPWHCEEEPLNHHETPGRQIKQSNQLSLPHQDDCNTRMDIK